MKFVDGLGDEWTISFTLGDIRRFKRTHGIDVTSGPDMQPIAEGLATRLLFLFDWLEPQRVKLNVMTIDDWENRLSGHHANDATEALFTELANFMERMGQPGYADQLRQTSERIMTNLGRASPPRETSGEQS